MIAPFMNAPKTKDGYEFAKNFHFLGRSGLKVIKGLRIAYVSGLDCDMLGSEVRNANPETHYLGNYFVKSDIDKVLAEYHSLV